MQKQPIIWNFEHQNKGNTRKSIKGRFKQSDTVKATWKKKREYFRREYLKAKEGIDFTRGANSMLNLFQKLADPNSSINKLKVDSTDYVMPIYKNNFIHVQKKGKRYVLKMENHVLKELEDYDRKINTKVKVVKYTSKKGYTQTKIIKGTKDYRKIPILEEADFNTLKTRKNILEKRFVKIQKDKYEEYFKTNKYT